jgi:hypothetical protein
VPEALDAGGASAGIGKPPTAFAAGWSALAGRLRRAPGWIAVFGPALVVFVAPALVNGFPLFFDDTGTYLRCGVQEWNPGDRPVYYGLFLAPLHLRLTLWPVVLAQSAVALAVLAIFFNHALAPLPRLHLALLLLLSGLLSSLPFFASQIMPDVFAPLMVAAMASLVFYRERLSRLERGFLFLVVLASICFHQANFLIAGVALAAAWLFRLLVTRRLGGLGPFVAPGLAVALGVGLLMAPNFVRHHRLTTTPAGSAFFLAKVIEDGPGLDYLTAVCPARRYPICSQVPMIRRYRDTASPALLRAAPLTDFILWDGPIRDAGGWPAVTPYARAVSFAAIHREPGAFVRASVQDFASQLMRFATGDSMGRLHLTAFMLRSLRQEFPAGVTRDLMRSRQETGTLHLEAVSLADQTVVVLGAALLIGLLAAGAEPTLAAVVPTFLVAIVGNAMVAGVLSGVHDRYQSRITSLVVVAGLALTYSHIARRRALAAQA